MQRLTKRYNRYKCDNGDNRDKPDWQDTRQQGDGANPLPKPQGDRQGRPHRR